MGMIPFYVINRTLKQRVPIGKFFVDLAARPLLNVTEQVEMISKFYGVVFFLIT